MTLLTSLIVVFSMITASVAIAGTGAKAGEGSPSTDTMMNMTQEGSGRQVQEPACEAGVPDSDCASEPARTQTRDQMQVREHDGECLGTDEECEAAQERTQARDRDQIRSNDGECVGTDPACEQRREMNRSEIEERIMKRFAFVDGRGDGEYLRALVRWMYAHMYGPISALFA
jgi:hypothetical protein